MHLARLARRAGGAVALAGCLALGGLMAPSAFADPPGNNGTIKIDAEEFDSHPDNQPHDGCVFQVDFYGFDEGDLFADVTFESQAPTGPVVTLLTDTVDIGEDGSSGANEGGLDASVTYTLDFTGIEPHPKQGFHVKLTIDADGAKGDGPKHKVFWVEECVTPTPSDTPEPEPEPSDTPEPEPSDTPMPEPSASVETPAAVPTEVPAGADSAGGGGSAAGLLGLVVAGGAVAGTAVFARRRFLHDS
jgi:hypothetical protein